MEMRLGSSSVGHKKVIRIDGRWGEGGDMALSKGLIKDLKLDFACGQSWGWHRWHTAIGCCGGCCAAAGSCWVQSAVL